MKQFGIIGYPLGHSFSMRFFNDKFHTEHIAALYQAFPLSDISEFPSLCKQHTFSGLNVTYPYKEQIIPYLDEVDDVAKTIGAVNVICFKNNKKIGYNTDTVGFRLSLEPYLHPKLTSALILGTGGAAKAVNYALRKLDIKTTFVSRNPHSSNIQANNRQQCIGYQDINQDLLNDNLLIINCTPLGMMPFTYQYPPIPYDLLTPKHLLYDLIYNPEETRFLQFGKSRGCTVVNGLQMLYQQAIAAWDIWTNN